MKVYLNKAAWLATASHAVVTPANFNDADMQQVITLGNQIINSGKYSLTPKYFDNFGPQNATLGKGEEILACDSCQRLMYFVPPPPKEDAKPAAESEPAVHVDEAAAK